ncbi:hypothetical protein AOY38_08955 [Synechocystis sp. PCC 6803]|nr:DUF4926 domain-containing protein [Synechocystis sp. PCC 6803]AVP91308.1 DUF4926 domain-containing protein [Synechocystis sp. IPPAS B-1465]MBD2619191.1 DUF4926 domain-containing protein [Synechocystis sp. FACHB-898]MBD2639577.1 DUF4926 domain-containing protein [Synechocystis sp. FACHB-908]MBD2661786.1 DUF4926 domain-containing protein [Synechocystis sp. FACHB-929]ALJ69466.1 hypothetical protein AOY38_08955 [Synechocystis sp. PCC 6803]
MDNLQLHSLVALKEDITAKLFLTSQPILLRQGQVGTIIEILGGGEAFEVEFADGDGQAYAMLAVPREKLMALHDQPILLAS